MHNPGSLWLKNQWVIRSLRCYKPKFALLSHTYCVCSVMASSHRRRQQDKTVSSCLVGIRGVNWIGNKSTLSVTENFATVLSSLEMRSEQSLVLSWPSFQFARNVVTYCDIIFGNWVKTSSEMRSHRRRDWTKNCSVSNILKTVYDCHELSSHHRQDKTRQSCLSCRCRRCELGITETGSDDAESKQKPNIPLITQQD